METNHQPNPTDTSPRDPRLATLQRQLSEAFDELWNGFVDREDAFYDFDGTRWSCLDWNAAPGAPAGIIANQQQLTEIRNECRALAVGNPFAINGHDYHLSQAAIRWQTQ
jgi:hypothetical protein